MVNLYLPVYLLISAVFVAIFGVRIIPDLLLIFVSALNFSIFVLRCLKNRFHFPDPMKRIVKEMVPLFFF